MLWPLRVEAAMLPSLLRAVAGVDPGHEIGCRALTSTPAGPDEPPIRMPPSTPVPPQTPPLRFRPGLLLLGLALLVLAITGVILAYLPGSDTAFERELRLQVMAEELPLQEAIDLCAQLKDEAVRFDCLLDAIQNPGLRYPEACGPICDDLPKRVLAHECRILCVEHSNAEPAEKAKTCDGIEDHFYRCTCYTDMQDFVTARWRARSADDLSRFVPCHRDCADKVCIGHCYEARWRRDLQALHDEADSLQEAEWAERLESLCELHREADLYLFVTEQGATG